MSGEFVTFNVDYIKFIINVYFEIFFEDIVNIFNDVLLNVEKKITC